MLSRARQSRVSSRSSAMQCWEMWWGCRGQNPARSERCEHPPVFPRHSSRFQPRCDFARREHAKLFQLSRAVAQLGSALDWGSRGRKFKSCQPDSTKERVAMGGPFFRCWLLSPGSPPRRFRRIAATRDASTHALPRCDGRAGGAQPPQRKGAALSRHVPLSVSHGGQTSAL